MRLSVILFIFLLLFNVWGGVMQDYGIDDHLGINAETGDAEALTDAQASAQNVSTGETEGQTLLGYYSNLLNTMEDITTGVQPGVQLLANILPPGIARSLVVWGFSILTIISVVDILYFARGGGL